MPPSSIPSKRETLLLRLSLEQNQVQATKWSHDKHKQDKFPFYIVIDSLEQRRVMRHETSPYCIKYQDLQMK